MECSVTFDAEDEGGGCCRTGLRRSDIAWDMQRFKSTNLCSTGVMVMPATRVQPKELSGAAPGALTTMTFHPSRIPGSEPFRKHANWRHSKSWDLLAQTKVPGQLPLLAGWNRGS